MDSRTLQSRAFPSLKRRGGCGINQKSRSHRRAADGVVAHKPCFKTHSETYLVSDHPVRAVFETGPFFEGADSPPLQGGEYLACNSSTPSKSKTQTASLH